MQCRGRVERLLLSNRTLIRRLSFDLTGLPPTRDEIQAFLADDSLDTYERLINRLLAKPQYGEHMTRHWLDLVRFADTNGAQRHRSRHRIWHRVDGLDRAVCGVPRPQIRPY
jgi:hypothetical protein